MSNDVILAGRIRRLLATAIDMVLVPSLTLIVMMATDVVEDAEDWANPWWVLVLRVFGVAVLSYLILNGYTLMRRGQTLGKLLLGIAIVPAAAVGSSAAELHPVPLWKLIFIRALFFPLLFLLVVAVVIPWVALIPVLDQIFAFARNRRCLHDYAAGTAVVRRLTSPSA
tara:strand:+ start:143 stop:649 length:507 start_codon:yes stop_codon:yes gene_type:complete